MRSSTSERMKRLDGWRAAAVAIASLVGAAGIVGDSGPASAQETAGTAAPSVFLLERPGGAVTPLPASGTTAAVVVDHRGGGARVMPYVPPDPDADRLAIVELRTAAALRGPRGPRGVPPPAALQRIADEQARVEVEITRLQAGRRGGPRPAVRHRFRLVFNGLAVSLPQAALDALAQHPDVAAIHPDVAVRVSLDNSLAAIHAPDFWAAHGNYRGAGEIIAVIDSGVDYSHPDLGGCGAVGPSCKVIGGYDFQNNDANPDDDNGHGTHVAAIAAANGDRIGVAPDAKILAYKVVDASGSGLSSTVIAGIERAVDPNQDNDSSDHADVINLSLAGPGDPDDPTSQAVDAATAAGVLVAAAAGNSFDYFTVGSPGTARTAVTVGATNDGGDLASFSSGGPIPTTFAIKPEIAAPGVDICAARAGGVSASGALCLDSKHQQLSGTSMATPQVAGAAALLRGVFPTYTPAEIKSLLVQNAGPFGAGQSVFKLGAGHLDVEAAGGAHTVLDPQTLPFGLCDNSVATWTTSKTLTVTNRDAVSRSYTIDTGTPPAGVALTATPSTFTLGTGVSTTVQFDLSVDTALVPNVTSEPFAYEGFVEITAGGETQRVPWAFAKGAAVLQLHFDTPPSAGYAHNRASWWKSLAFTNTTSLTLYVPQGLIDVMIWFGPSKYVVHEGISVSGTVDHTINSTEATHVVSFTLRDQNDTIIPDASLAWVLRHRTYGIDLSVFTLGAAVSGSFNISDVSSDYDFDVVGYHGGDATSDDYFATQTVSSGITADVQLGNAGSDLTSGQVSYHGQAIDPDSPIFDGTEYNSAFFKSGFGVSGPPGQRPVVDHTLWVSPANPGGLWFASTDVLFGPTTLYGPFYRGGSGTGTIQAYNFFDNSNPAYSTTTGDLPVRLGPAHWFGRFDNTATTVALRPAVGDQRYFHDQGGDGPQANAFWSLSSGAGTVASGALIQNDVPQLFGSADVIVDPLPQDSYVLSGSMNSYSLAGAPATTTVQASFTLASGPADVNPPWVESFTLRGGDGRLTDTVAQGEPLTLDLIVHDESGVTVGVSHLVGAVETPLSVATMGGDHYQVDLTALCGDAGGVNLIVTAADSTGNSVRNVLSPAYLCRGCPPQPLSGCRRPVTSGKAFLALKDNADDRKDQLIWRWTNGAATSSTDFGDPLNTTFLEVCLYDGSGLLSAVEAPPGGVCAGKRCWKGAGTPAGTKGYKYADKELTPNGLSNMGLKPGADRKAKIVVKGKGANLPMPSLNALVSPVVVQLQSPTGACWEAVYSSPFATSTSSSFKDKSD